MQPDHLPSDVRCHHRNMPADQIGEARPGALVRDVDQIGEAGELLEQFAREIAHGAGAGGAIGKLPWIGPGVGDQFLQRLHRHRWMGDDRRGRDGKDGDRHKVLGRIVRHLRHGHRVEHHGAGAAEQERVAVRLRAGDFQGRDRAARSALILDIDGAEQRLHLVGPLPADHIVHAASRERHHQLDRPFGIFALREDRERPQGRSTEGRQFTLADDIRAITPHARHVYANTAKRAGLAVTGLHWLLVSPKGLSVTNQEDAVRAETADYLAALVDFCADMSGNILVLGSPAQRRIPPGDRSAIAADRLRACLEPALKRAEQQAITICLEPLPPPEADFILTLQQAVNLVREFNHPALKTIFDVKSASSEGTPLSDLIRRFAPYIAHVHANDANRRGPGFGNTDFVPVPNAPSGGYTGYISIEVFDYTPDPTTIARDGLAYLKRCEAIVKNRQ